MSGKQANDGFGFDTDVAIAHLRASDATLASLIDRVGPFGMELKRASSLFDVLAEAIVYQQLHARAAASIYTRVRALIPRTRGVAAARAVAHVSDEALRGAGLSRSKLLALRDLAAKTLDGHVPTLAKVRRMDDEAIIEHLTAGARHRTLDRADAADVPPRASRCPAGRRLRCP